MKEKYTQQELDAILAKTKQRVGWDFSSMQTIRQNVPWDYAKEVEKYLDKDIDVLDIGTGGGEIFIKLSPRFKYGLGVDSDVNMVSTARNNSRDLRNVEFKVVDYRLSGITRNFDLIIDRHAPFDVSVIYNHLKKDGYFITQQVGEKNMLNIKKASSQLYNMPVINIEDISKNGFTIVTYKQYDVEYVVKDIESLVFWLNALDIIHADLNTNEIINNVNVLNTILKGNVDDRGFVTNEHRYLLIAAK